MKKLLSAIVLITLLLLSGCQSIEYPTETLTPEVTTTQKPTAAVTAAPEPTADKEEFVSSRTLGRSDFKFITTKNNEKIEYSSNLTIPSYVDVVSVSKMIDDTDIFFYIELREIPDTITVNYDRLRSGIMEYCWYISFDTNLDDAVSDNLTFNHHKFTDSQQPQEQVAIDGDAFQTVLLQHQNRTDYIVTEDEFYIEGNTMIFHAVKGDRDELIKVTDDTPFCILSECVMPGFYFCDIIPEKDK